jgi:hypothetical protein
MTIDQINSIPLVITISYLHMDEKVDHQLPDGERIHRDSRVLQVPGQQQEYSVVPVLQAVHKTKLCVSG